MENGSLLDYLRKDADAGKTLDFSQLVDIAAQARILPIVPKKESEFQHSIAFKMLNYA